MPVDGLELDRRAIDCIIVILYKINDVTRCFLSSIITFELSSLSPIPNPTIDCQISASHVGHCLKSCTLLQIGVHLDVSLAIISWWSLRSHGVICEMSASSCGTLKKFLIPVKTASVECQSWPAGS